MATQSENRSLRQEWSHNIRWELLPIYVGLSGLSLILGALTMVVFVELGISTEVIDRLGRLFAVLGAFYLTWPFLSPAIEVAYNHSRWGQGD